MSQIMYKTYSHPEGVKDLSKSGDVGLVLTYINAFGNKDLDGDISGRNSFDETIVKDFKRIKHFLNHETGLFLGLPEYLKTDDIGLFVLSKMDLTTELGMNTYRLYEFYAKHGNGRNVEHSIGFAPPERNAKNPALIEKYSLWEYSTLTAWGANPLSTTISLMTEEEIKAKKIELEQKVCFPFSDILRKKYENDLKLIEKVESEKQAGTPKEEIDKNIFDIRKTIELYKQIK